MFQLGKTIAPPRAGASFSRPAGTEILLRALNPQLKPQAMVSSASGVTPR